MSYHDDYGSGCVNGILFIIFAFFIGFISLKGCVSCADEAYRSYDRWRNNKQSKESNKKNYHYLAEDIVNKYQEALNDKELPVLKLIYSKYRELKSLTKLETYLINNDVKTRKGANYSKFALKLILTNPVYAR